MLAGVPFAGATILGDGQIALILDVFRLGLAAGVVSETRAHTIASQVSSAVEERAHRTRLVCPAGSGRRADGDRFRRRHAGSNTSRGRLSNGWATARWSSTATGFSSSSISRVHCPERRQEAAESGPESRRRNRAGGGLHDQRAAGRPDRPPHRRYRRGKPEGPKVGQSRRGQGVRRHPGPGDRDSRSRSGRSSRRPRLLRPRNRRGVNRGTPILHVFTSATSSSASRSSRSKRSCATLPSRRCPRRRRPSAVSSISAARSSPRSICARFSGSKSIAAQTRRRCSSSTPATELRSLVVDSVGRRRRGRGEGLRESSGHPQGRGAKADPRRVQTPEEAAARPRRRARFRNRRRRHRGHRHDGCSRH